MPNMPTPPTINGVLTGSTPLCTVYAATHPNTVFVYRSRRLVAKTRVATGDSTYRFALPAGEYVVRFSSPSAESFPVVVAASGTAHGPDWHCF